jgi:hypothetical protein
VALRGDGLYQVSPRSVRYGNFEYTFVYGPPPPPSKSVDFFTKLRACPTAVFHELQNFLNSELLCSVALGYGRFASRFRAFCFPRKEQRIFNTLQHVVTAYSLICFRDPKTSGVVVLTFSAKINELLNAASCITLRYKRYANGNSV